MGCCTPSAPGALSGKQLVAARQHLEVLAAEYGGGDAVLVHVDAEDGSLQVAAAPVGECVLCSEF